MPVDVVMPQMGESIAEGTVIKWMKKVGDKVERDEPLFEISTDKVDAEIPSPAAGVLTEVLVQEGQTVAVNSVVARLSSEGSSAGASAPPAAPASPGAQASQPAGSELPSRDAAVAAPAPPPAAPSAEKAPAQPADNSKPQINPAPSAVSSGDLDQESVDQESVDQETVGQENVESIDERRRTRSSPLVRKIAAENKVDIAQIKGSGLSGRVTKQDILQHLDSPAPAPAPARAGAATPAPEAKGPSTPMFAPGVTEKIEPLSMMRKRIAHHMIESKKTSAHVTTVFEVDFSEIDKLRKKHKNSYAERGAKLTYLPFIVHAVNTGLREFPVLNASLDGDNVVYHGNLNVGIAVALDWGLIVPVIKNADEKNILGLSKAINDLGERARGKKLNPDDVQNGTFTITNPGVYGGLFGTPIINQPQVAILGVGGVKKRPVVIETAEGDAIVIRSMCYLALTFDHRLIDGAVADQFMARIRSIIESGQFAL